MMNSKQIEAKIIQIVKLHLKIKGSYLDHNPEAKVINIYAFENKKYKYHFSGYYGEWADDSDVSLDNMILNVKNHIINLNK